MHDFNRLLCDSNIPATSLMFTWILDRNIGLLFTVDEQVQLCVNCWYTCCSSSISFTTAWAPSLCSGWFTHLHLRRAAASTTHFSGNLSCELAANFHWLSSRQQDNKQLYPLLLNTCAGWQGFRILDMVWHRFVCQFGIGLHAGLDDNEMVCMLVCCLREMVWMTAG